MAAISRPINLNDESYVDISRNGFNEHAESYAKWSSALKAPRLQWLEKLLNYVDPDTAVRAHQSALELGCGGGNPNTLRLCQTFGKVVAVDISSTQIARAKKYLTSGGGNNIEFREANMLDVQFDENSFNAICAFYSLMHLPPPEQSKLLARCHGWLRDGGHVLFNVPAAASSEHGDVADSSASGMKMFWASLGTDKTLAMVKDAGLEVVEHEVVPVKGDMDFVWVIARKGGKGQEASNGDKEGKKGVKSRVKSIVATIKDKLT